MRFLTVKSKEKSGLVLSILRSEGHVYGLDAWNGDQIYRWFVTIQILRKVWLFYFWRVK